MLDWFGIYRKHLDKWSGCALRIEKVRFENAINDPIPHRIQISYYSTKLGERIYGYGDSLREMHAYEKAICELIERESLYESSDAYKLQTTNGIACHRWSVLAKNVAKTELLERDAFLRHWLTKTPLKLIDMPNDSILLAFKESLLKVDHELFVCQSSIGSVETFVAVILNKKTNGFLIGSSAAAGKVQRMRKAVGEAYYSLFNRQSTKIDWDHATFDNHSNYWYYEKSIPDWFISANSSQMQYKPLKKPSIYYHNLLYGKPCVWVARASEVIDLWHGQTPSAVADKISSDYNLIPNLEIHPFP